MHDTGNTGSELNLLIHLRPETENKTGTLSGMCVPMTITHGVGFPCWLVTMTRCIMLVTPGLGHIIIVSGQRGLDRAILQLPSVTPHRGREDIRLIFVLCTGYPRKSTMLCVFTFLWDSITFTFAVLSFKRVTLHWPLTGPALSVSCVVWEVYYGYNLVNGGRFDLICQLVQKYMFGGPWKMGFLSISGQSVHAPYWFWLPQPAIGSD